MELVSFFLLAQQTPSGPGPPHARGSEITHNDALHSIGLLWTRDQLVAETSTLRHTTLTADKHPCPRGIQTQAAAELRHRPRGRWGRHGVG
jgi:hypothetical protein